MDNAYAAAEIRLTKDISAFFRAKLITEVRRHPTYTFTAMFPIFQKRLDEDNMRLILPPCEGMPREFHACVTTASAVLVLTSQNNHVYDGDKDVRIVPRGIVQNNARWYGVDPSEMMAQWHTVRRYLSHKQIDLPDTIEAALLHQQQKGKAEIRRYH